MQLTKQTDFAFRALMYLGEQPANTLSHIQDISDYHAISTHHLSKVVGKLVKLGYVEALRGKGGGIRLARPPSAIPLADVIRAFETTLKPVNCDAPRCAIRRRCKLRHLLDDAMAAFLNTLEGHTLADLLPPSSAAIAHG